MKAMVFSSKISQKDFKFLWEECPKIPLLGIWKGCDFEDLEIREDIYEGLPQKGENLLLAIYARS